MVFQEGDPKNELYPYMRDFTSFLKPMERPLIGRDREMTQLMAAMQRPELCNVILLADAGSGKTALVQGTMLKDKNRAYLEVDLPKMIANLKNENEMADKLKRLFGEVAQYRKSEGREIVLFIDEFHQIVQLSPAAVEVLKPLLADSGTRGIRVIAATTYIEFQNYISSNQPLVERLQRINLVAPGKDTTVSILEDMAKRYGVINQFKGTSMFEAIYEYTNRYIPANAQPRKSILIMDSMIGWHRLTGAPMDMKMLADVIYDTEGVNIAFRVDATKIKAELDKNVIAQQYATSAIESRLQICCADLNNKDRPMSSFLFTGSTGVGKATTCSTQIPVFTSNGVFFKSAGKVRKGDYVFDRQGNPTKVLGVFPQGKRDVYRVTFTDGRYLDVSDNHLWAVFPAKRARNEGYTIYSTETLINKGLRTHNKGSIGVKYYIPMNGSVKWPETDHKIEPYAAGIISAVGSEDGGRFILATKDNHIIDSFCNIMDCVIDGHDRNGYYFKSSDGSSLMVDDDMMHIIHHDGIVREYMYGSELQRWDFVRGLFDCFGRVTSYDGDRCRIQYKTESDSVANDLRSLLYSLGIGSFVKDVPSKNGETHMIVVDCANNRKKLFFSHPVKLRKVSNISSLNKRRQVRYDYVGIDSIEKLDRQEEMVCFYVDNDEHLYQAGEYVVTHNTETCKQLARILFDDEKSLIRMDMTEYALDESLNRFREELTTSVWERPYSIILLDEIEKACSSVTRVLLQVLDDGRLLDRNNREVTFKNAYIIVTTNAGSEIYKTISQYAVDNTGSGKLLEKYDALIRESIKGTTGGGKFPPELLGRIDCIVPFQPLSEQTMAKICMMKLDKLKAEVKRKHHVNLVIDSKLIRYIVQDKMTTDSDAGGARGVVSRLEREVTVEVAKFINEHPSVRDNRPIYVNVEGDLMIDNKLQLESAAYVVVTDRPPSGAVLQNNATNMIQGKSPVPMRRM